MGQIVQPPHIRQVEIMAGNTRNGLEDLTSRQGLESGTPGPPGEKGEPGEPGPPAETYVFSEGTPSLVWVIKHELKRFPSVTVQDTAGDEVMGIVDYVSNEELTITFSATVTGKAYLN